jgi:hypothetical protein
LLSLCIFLEEHSVKRHGLPIVLGCGFRLEELSHIQRVLSPVLHDLTVLLDLLTWNLVALRVTRNNEVLRRLDHQSSSLVARVRSLPPNHLGDVRRVKDLQGVFIALVSIEFLHNFNQGKVFVQVGGRRLRVRLDWVVTTFALLLVQDVRSKLFQVNIPFGLDITGS